MDFSVTARSSMEWATERMLSGCRTGMMKLICGLMTSEPDQRHRSRDRVDDRPEARPITGHACVAWCHSASNQAPCTGPGGAGCACTGHMKGEGPVPKQG